MNERNVLTVLTHGCLGHGETILKYCLAHAIVKRMELGQSAQEATEAAIKKMTERLKNTAGKKRCFGVVIVPITARFGW